MTQKVIRHTTLHDSRGASERVTHPEQAPPSVVWAMAFGTRNFLELAAIGQL